MVIREGGGRKYLANDFKLHIFSSGKYGAWIVYQVFFVNQNMADQKKRAFPPVIYGWQNKKKSKNVDIWVYPDLAHEIEISVCKKQY